MPIYGGLFGTAKCPHAEVWWASWQCKVSPCRYMVLCENAPPLQPSPHQVLLLADQHGTNLRFQIQPISCYNGGDDVPVTKAFDGFIQNEYTDKWSPFMFMFVVSIFWGILDVMMPTSCVCISILGPT